jgi:hypothetical protein
VVVASRVWQIIESESYLSDQKRKISIAKIGYQPELSGFLQSMPSTLHSAVSEFLILVISLAAAILRESGQGLLPKRRRRAGINFQFSLFACTDFGDTQKKALH